MVEFSLQDAFAARALPTINRIARDPDCVWHSSHAMHDRMGLRDVTFDDIRYCLMTGSAVDDIRRGQMGDLVYRVVGTCTEGKPLRVAVVITDDDELMVVTVIR